MTSTRAYKTNNQNDQSHFSLYLICFLIQLMYVSISLLTISFVCTVSQIMIFL